MKSYSSRLALSALALVLAAGTAATASGQNSGQPARESTGTTVPYTVDFRTANWLSDRKVVNNSGEDIANVSDLILDRGAGRIEYIVIKTGTTLGMGGKKVAVPYNAFRWETGKDRFVLASTTEQLKQSPEFSADNWKAMMESKKDDKNALRQRLETDAASSGDPYAGDLDTAKKHRIEGEITKVERVRTSTFGEQVVITVETPDGSNRNVALGPSWFVNGTAAAPMRGDKVVIETLELPRDPDHLLAATNFRSGERELRLRDSVGSPTWALKSVETGGNSYSRSYSRYLLLSNLTGMKVDCRGNDVGKVHNVILDRNSGEIGFLSIDPNQNFLGISDTKRLVPWSVATVSYDGIVRIDASKDMVLASPETPSELSLLNTGPTAEMVYTAYKVKAPRFDAQPAASAILPNKDNAWSARGTIIGSIDRDSARTIEGKVVDITEVKFDGGVQPARALKIRLAGDGAKEEVVLLGPAWYMENQKPMCQAGDSIRVDARRTRIDGRSYWIAKSVDCKDSRVVLLDGSDTPVWARP